MSFSKKDLSSLTSWKPLNARQKEALSRTEFEVGIGGERGGGKSEVGIVWMLEPEYVNHPEYRSLTIRKNSVDLADWIFRFKSFTKGNIEISGNPLTIKWPGGGMGTLGHLANKDSWSHYVGHQYQKMLFEELNILPDEQRYLMLLGSCRSSHEELKRQTMSSFNPGNVGHFWVKKRFVDVAREKTYIDPKSGLSRIFIRLKLKENTALPAEYEATLRLLPEAIQRAWIDGDWDALAGMFFTQMPEIEQARYIDPIELNLYGSLDFGSSTTGHTSFGMWHIGRDNVPVRLFTWYHRLGHTAGEQAAELIEYIKSFPYTHGMLPKKVFADPAIFTKGKIVENSEEVKSTADFFKDRGLDMVPANNSRANGWVVMRDYFGLDPLTKRPKMKMWDGYNGSLLESIEVQIHDENNPDDIKSNDFDHAVDECRYGLMAFHSMRASTVIDEHKAVSSVSRVRNNRDLAAFNNKYKNSDSGVY